MEDVSEEGKRTRRRDRALVFQAWKIIAAEGRKAFAEEATTGFITV